MEQELKIDKIALARKQLAEAEAEHAEQLELERQRIRIEMSEREAKSVREKADALAAYQEKIDAHARKREAEAQSRVDEARKRENESRELQIELAKIEKQQREDAEQDHIAAQIMEKARQLELDTQRLKDKAVQKAVEITDQDIPVTLSDPRHPLSMLFGKKDKL